MTLRLIVGSIRVFFVGLSLIVNSPTGAAEPLRVGILHFPPLYIIQNDRPPTGLMIDIIEEKLRPSGIEFEFIPFPIGRLYFQLDTGDINLFAGIKGYVKYEKNVLYSKQPVTTIELRVYGMNDKTIPTNMQELLGKSLGLLLGAGYGTRRQELTTAENKKYITVIRGHKSGLQMLESGHVDFLLDYKASLEEELIKYPVNNLAYETLDKIDVYFILNKNTPDARAIMAVLEGSPRAPQAPILSP
ncbi:MAG: transporter substrate-binding domain-containing protein [Pseudomonadales bacterium]|nr:transporter substrate-binding domain-containing protein [Pseudomonadales bacterium]